MNQSLLRHWLGLGLLGSALVLGCHHAQRDCGCGSTAQHVGSATMLPGYPGAPGPASLPALKPVESVKKETPKASSSIILASAKEETVKRRSYADITAHPCFSHAKDYSWLTGELQYLSTKQAWRLRFASVDEDVRYAGSVLLVEPGPMTNYLSGQMVRVEGHSVEPDTNEPDHSYRVSAIHPLPPQ